MYFIFHLKAEVFGLLINVTRETNTENNISDESNTSNGTSFPLKKNGSSVIDQSNIDTNFLDKMEVLRNYSIPKNAYLKPAVLTRIQGFLSCLQGDDRLPENQTGAGVGFSKIFLEIVNPHPIKEGFSEIERDNGLMRIGSIFDSVSPLLLAPLGQIRNSLLYEDPLRFPHVDERVNVAKLYNNVFLPSSINESSNNVTKAKSDTSLKEAILNPFFLRPLIGKTLNRKYENNSNEHTDQHELSVKELAHSTEISNDSNPYFIVPVTLNPIQLNLSTSQLISKRASNTNSADIPQKNSSILL